MVPAPYLQVLQAVIVQDTVVDTFTGCAFTVYFPEFFGIPWDTGMKTKLAVILYVNSPTIVAMGTFISTGAGIYAAAFQRTAVFVGTFYGVIAPWAHLMPCGAEGMPVFIKCDVLWCIFG